MNTLHTPFATGLFILLLAAVVAVAAVTATVMVAFQPPVRVVELPRVTITVDRAAELARLERQDAERARRSILASAH